MTIRSLGAAGGLLAFLVAGCGSMGGTTPATVRDGVLTAPNGMTLYTFDRDPVGAGKSACNGPCAASWPPLAASGAESGGTGGGYGSYGGYGGSGAGSGGDYSVITRDDGSKQVAYKGKPLYFWINDKKPGDRTGDGFNGVWHAARP